MTLAQGQVLENRYRIVSLLGQGGMGAVYRAWDLNLRVPVALKENLELSGESRSQFEHEALLLAQLSHPNLPRVTNHFHVPGQGQYLVMEYIDGQDLQEMLEQRGRLAEAEALPIIGQILSALSYLHSRPEPIIHRDIKPANIKIDSSGRAVLVDFGIAKRYLPEHKTTRGAQAITPGFSPPEQYGLGSTDARSDIYATGATLYALLTGDTPVESVSRLAGATLSPPTGITPPVSRAILRAMEMDPINRYQRAEELAAGLSGRGVEPRPQVRQRSLWPLFAVVALLLTIGGGFLVWQLLDGGPESTDATPTAGLQVAAVEATLTAAAETQSAALSATVTAAAEAASLVGDNDGDLLSDDQETALATDPGNPDSDGDSLSDGVEVLFHRTDPNAADTDGDGVGDGEEVAAGTNPGLSEVLAATEAPPAATSPPPVENATATPTSPPPVEEVTLVEETIGFSAGGRPITLYTLGDGPRIVTLVGGIHAGFAPSGVEVVASALDHFAANPDQLPDSVALHFIPNANPDSPLNPGNVAGRLNANGVDLNRNFGCDWSPNSTTSSGTPLNEGSGPFSEPETQALRDYFLDVRPSVTIFYEARATNGLVTPGECDGDIGDSGDFGQVYASASGYPYAITDPVSGDASNWLVQQGMPAFFVLLHEYTGLTGGEWADNLDGIREVIGLAGG